MGWSCVTSNACVLSVYVIFDLGVVSEPILTLNSSIKMLSLRSIEIPLIRVLPSKFTTYLIDMLKCNKADMLPQTVAKKAL